MEKCKTCHFWRPAKRGKPETWTHYDGGRSYIIEHAQCRRRAPVAIVEHGYRKLAEAKWPETNADDWCGEHVTIPTSSEPDARAERVGERSVHAEPLPTSTTMDDGGGK